MYAPLKYIEGLRNILDVETKPEAENTRTAPTRQLIWDYLLECDSVAFFDTIIQHHKDMGVKCPYYKTRKFHVKKKFLEFAEKFEVQDNEDNYDAWISLVPWVLATDTWYRSKRVYKVQKDLIQQFCTMDISKINNADVMTKLPSKSFYIDYSDNPLFCKELAGCFVVFRNIDDVYLWRLININTKDLNDTTVDLVVKLSEGVSDMHVVLEKDECAVNFDKEMFVKFFVNFCMYLYAANNDVEYTERTKAIYRPRNPEQQPTNKMREIEEFGVGFKRSSTISMSSKTKIRYVGNSEESKQKRSYSSHYRCAHWHHFWINDPENPGAKKLIVKWIDEVYVQGNNTDNRVMIHNVTK